MAHGMAPGVAPDGGRDPLDSLDSYRQDKTTYSEVLSQADPSSMHSILRQRRLRWLGHLHRMENKRIQKDTLYGMLSSGKWITWCPKLRNKVVVKRDKKLLDKDTRSWRPFQQSDWRSPWLNSWKQGMQQKTCGFAGKSAELRQTRDYTQMWHMWQNISPGLVSSATKKCCSSQTNNIN